MTDTAITLTPGQQRHGVAVPAERSYWAIRAMDSTVRSPEQRFWEETIGDLEDVDEVAILDGITTRMWDESPPAGPLTTQTDSRPQRTGLERATQRWWLSLLRAWDSVREENLGTSENRDSGTFLARNG